VTDYEILVSTEMDIIAVREKVRDVAKGLGFSIMDLTRIATAVSELVRNAFQYAGGGTVTIKTIQNLHRKGLEVIVDDHGPGIPELDLALKGGHSTSGGMGLGLAGAKKLMDDFFIDTKQNVGTTIVIRKWL